MGWATSSALCRLRRLREAEGGSTQAPQAKVASEDEVEEKRNKVTPKLWTDDIEV